ncbi:MAG: glycosyltransferase [Candidatus Methanofastidiosia archaeon]
MDISIVIPTLNEEKNLLLCLDSIRASKTQLSFEVIVSDSGSRDKTLKIAKAHRCRIVTTTLKGMGLGRNLGAKKAISNHLLFLDADTYLPKNYLEIAHKRFEDEELIAFAAGFKFSKKVRKLKVAENFTNSYFAFRDILDVATLPGFNTNVRREVFERLGGFRNVPLEDVDFSRRVRKLGKIRYFREFYVFTSSRRLEGMGVLGTLNYYMKMGLLKDFPEFERFLKTEYVEVRGFPFSFDKGYEKKISSRGELESIKILLDDLSFKRLSSKIQMDRALQVLKSKYKKLKGGSD